MTEPKTYVRTELFDVAADYGIVYLLTKCCGASAKGSFAGDEPATVCRGCYRVIPDWMGMAWAVKDGGSAPDTPFGLADLLREQHVLQPEMTAERVFVEARKDMEAAR